MALIYVCGPYTAATTAQREANVDRACRAGLSLIQRGHWPVIPHLTHFYDLWHNGAYGFVLDPETYMQWDFDILRRCDGLLYLAPSPGADREVALATELGLPVWRSVEDVPR